MYVPKVPWVNTQGFSSNTQTNLFTPVTHSAWRRKRYCWLLELRFSHIFEKSLSEKKHRHFMSWLHIHNTRPGINSPTHTSVSQIACTTELKRDRKNHTYLIFTVIPAPSSSTTHFFQYSSPQSRNRALWVSLSSSPFLILWRLAYNHSVIIFLDIGCEGKTIFIKWTR